MELTGAALQRFLPSAFPAGARRRRRPARVSCVGGRGFVEEGHLRYYEAATRRKAVEAVARDLDKLRAMGLVAGDAAKETVLSEATDILLQELNQMKDEGRKMKMVCKEEKSAMKLLKKQQKEAKKAAAVMVCEDGSSSESSESDCEDEAMMKVKQGLATSKAVPEVVTLTSGISTVSTSTMEREKAAMKAMKKLEKEQKKAAKKAMKKMEKEAKKMAMTSGCKDEDSSCSSESSDSECEGEVVRMSRAATIAASPAPSASTFFPIILPQIPESVAPAPWTGTRIPSEPATATAMQFSNISSIAAAEAPSANRNRIEVCMGGKCKKSGSLALLQEFEKAVGTGGGGAAAVSGCKCLGKCGLGPNVRLRHEGSEEGSVKKSPLCIGVGFEDVGAIVAGLWIDTDPGMAPA